MKYWIIKKQKLTMLLFNKISLFKLTLFLVILFCFYDTSGQKIRIENVNDSIQKIFFINDTILVTYCDVTFSPDSQLCGIVNQRKNIYTLYDNRHRLKTENRIVNRGRLRIGNDGRILIMQYHWGENTITTVDLFFYDQNYHQMKDTVCWNGTDAIYADDNNLILVHPNNMVGDRGSKVKKDTWVLVFDNNYNLKAKKLVNFPSKVLLPVHFITRSKEYVLKVVDYEDHFLESVKVKLF